MILNTITRNNIVPTTGYAEYNLHDYQLVYFAKKIKRYSLIYSS